MRLAPRALTLIELLVVIVILTTLVGGVLPVLSPNNDARRIREATRGLQTYIMQAQAHSARTGRPAGIAFRESSAGSGVALEVFQIEVPPPFAGFSQASASRVRQNLGDPSIMDLQFVLSNALDVDLLPVDGQPRRDLTEYDLEAFPPKFVKRGDIVVVGGVAFRLTDDNVDNEGFYFGEPSDDPQALIKCELVDPRQTLPVVENYLDVSIPYGITSPKGYQILRQPNAVTSSAAQPYQFPAGVCIDLQASGTEGGSTQTQFATAKYPATTLKQIGLLFSPSGGVDSIFFNGTKFGTNTLFDAPIKDASKVYLLLGRVENGGVAIDKREAFVVPPAGGQTGGANTKEQIAEVQNRINWMNLDSRWMAIDARNGRTVVGENAFVDPSNPKYITGPQAETVAGTVSLQAEDARALARNMQRGGER